MDFILKFSEKLPELFQKATPEERKLIISTMTKSIVFDGENIEIELKDTFKALQNLNKTEKIALRNDNLRTPENSIISTKNSSQEAAFGKWAGDVIFLEAVKRLIQIAKTQEYQYIEGNLHSLVA